jgi:peptidyl-prolyl cis-trans isomerase SurA
MNKRRIFVLAVFALALASAPALHAGQVIDRILAIVNGHVILESQLEDDLCFEALTGGRALHPPSEEDRRLALARLVDQELLREQTQDTDLPQPAPEQVQKRIQEIRASHPDSSSDSTWRATLARYGLDEKQLEARVALQLSLLREVDIRLRPSVQIDNDRIETYYRNVFLPELHRAGAADVPLPEVSTRIREILTQQKIDELFNSWLESLRKDSKVRTLLPENNPVSAAGASQ